MRLFVIIGVFTVLSNVAVDGYKTKKHNKHRRASHHRVHHPRSQLGRHGPFGLHGFYGPRYFKPMHDDLGRHWIYSSSESSELDSVYYDSRIDNDSNYHSSSEEYPSSRRRRPCSGRRCAPTKAPCQRNTTPAPTQTLPTSTPKPTGGWYTTTHSATGWWDPLLYWSTKSPSTRYTPEPVTSSKTTPTTTVRPEEATIPQNIVDCIDNCTSTPEFNPVCGTDSRTYINLGSLFCAKTCGVNVELRLTSVCPRPPFPDYEDYGENDSGETTSRIPPPPPTINSRSLPRTTSLTRYQQCMKICPITLNYKPVCGTDLVTYFNLDRLICAKECGQEVEVLCEKPCSLCTLQTTSTTTTTTPRTTTQSTTAPSTTPQSFTMSDVNDGRTTKASIELCFKACAITSEYNPVCGTNNVNYTNPGHLLCAQLCGEDVRVSRFAPCPPAIYSPTTTTEEDYYDITLPPNILACIRGCPATPEYNPVCGTNGDTYYNPSRLSCDKYCGINVEINYKGLCLGFLHPFLTSSAALAKLSTPIWKTSTVSTLTPSTSSTTEKTPITSSWNTLTTSSAPVEIPLIASWNTLNDSSTTSNTPTTLSMISNTSAIPSRNTLATSSTTSKSPITSSWNSPSELTTDSKTPITSSWNTPKTSLTTLKTPITSAWNTQILPLTTLETPITSSWNTPSTPAISSSVSPSTTPTTSSRNSLLLTTSRDSSSTIQTTARTLATTGNTPSSTQAAVTSTNEVDMTRDFTIPPDILSSIFTNVETRTQPNIVTTAADEDFSIDPRFGDKLEEDSFRMENKERSRIIFPDDR